MGGAGVGLFVGGVGVGGVTVFVGGVGVFVGGVGVFEGGVGVFVGGVGLFVGGPAVFVPGVLTVPFCFFVLELDRARTRARETVFATSALGGIAWVNAASRALPVATVMFTAIKSVSDWLPPLPPFFEPIVIFSSIKPRQALLSRHHQS